MSSNQSSEDAEIHTPGSSQSITGSHFQNLGSETNSPTGTTSSTYDDLHNATPNHRNRRPVENPPISSPLRAVRVSSPTCSVTGRLQNLDLIEGWGQPNEHGSGSGRSPTASVENNNRMETGLEHEQDDGADPFYNIRQEQLPSAPIYNSRLQGTLREVRNKFAELQHAIAGCPLVQSQGTNISELFTQLQNLSQYEYPKSRIVGFIGDSGVGKLD